MEALLVLANWSTLLVCMVINCRRWWPGWLAAHSAHGVSLVLELSGFVGGWYFLTLQKWIIDLAMNLCTLISAASKFAQLRCLWQTRDSGQVSALTWSMSAYACATRIVTTLMTTNDLMVLVLFIIMLVLNIWVTATILRYRKTGKTD